MKNVAPLNTNQKYYPLQRHLDSKRNENTLQVTMSFEDVNRLIEKTGKGSLPRTAYDSPSAFWGNDTGSHTHAQKIAWLSIGWRVSSRFVSTDKKTGLVTFVFSENDFPTSPPISLREANPRASNQSKPTVFKNYSTSNFSGTHAFRDISQAIGHFRAKSNPQDRYSSFDYCYNYFYTNEDPTNELEKSCLVLGFYLASWGMLRGSSFLLEKSAVHFKPLIIYLSTIKRSTWGIDVDCYSTENMEEIIRIYSDVKQLVISNREAHLTLVTKILLGVFGFIPAFDQYFRNTFKNIYHNERCGFTRVNLTSLNFIKHFYEINKDQIDDVASKTHTINFLTGLRTNIEYPRAKIIDMYGFTLGLQSTLSN